MRRFILITALLLFVGGAALPALAADDDAAPLAAIDHFLTSLALDDYAGCWLQASPLLQRLQPQETFIRERENGRFLLGRVVARQERVLKHRERMPKLPDGDYLILVYETRLEHKAGATEVITAHREADGSWLIADYDLY